MVLVPEPLAQSMSPDKSTAYFATPCPAATSGVYGIMVATVFRAARLGSQAVLMTLLATFTTS